MLQTRTLNCLLGTQSAPGVTPVAKRNEQLGTGWKGELQKFEQLKSFLKFGSHLPYLGDEADGQITSPDASFLTFTTGYHGRSGLLTTPLESRGRSSLCAIPQTLGYLTVFSSSQCPRPRSTPIRTRHPGVLEKTRGCHAFDTAEVRGPYGRSFLCSGTQNHVVKQ